MLRIGIVGAAGIAPAAIIRPAWRRDDVEVIAVASRNEAKARDFAAENGIPRVYDRYELLLADPDVDLVYVALPPSHHAEWSIAALEAGKDVLCEKPFAMNAEQAREMVATSERTGHRLIEAFHDRYHPLQAAIIDLKASGRLGAVHSLTATFSAYIPFDPTNIRHAPELGGGALMDLGCYAVHWVRSLMGEEPTVTAVTAERNPLGADLSIDATLDFLSGPRAHVVCSMAEGQKLTETLHIEAENGVVDARGLVFPFRGHSISSTLGGVQRTNTVAGEETYDHQLAAVIAALETGDPLPTEGNDPIGNMVVIDAIYAAAGFDR